MNNSDQPLSGQTSEPPARLYDTAGMMLRKARESANLTQAVVGEALHLTVHYIKALENDDYSKLPSPTFVKGYLRVYARYLKLDANAVLASYEKNNANAEELNSRTESSSRSQKRHDQTFKWAIVTAIIVVLGVAAGWWFVGKDQVGPSMVSISPPTTAQQAFSQSAPATVSVNQLASVPVVASGADVTPGATTSFMPMSGTSATIDTTTMTTDNGSQAAPGTEPALTAISNRNDLALTTTPTANAGTHVTLTTAGTDMLRLNFKGTSWVEIENSAEGRLYNETLNSGDAITLQGTAPFNILLGDAAQVDLSFNSIPINLSSQIRSDKTARFSLGIAPPSPNIATSIQGANP